MKTGKTKQIHFAETNNSSRSKKGHSAELGPFCGWPDTPHMLQYIGNINCLQIDLLPCYGFKDDTMLFLK